MKEKDIKQKPIPLETDGWDENDNINKIRFYKYLFIFISALFGLLIVAILNRQIPISIENKKERIKNKQTYYYEAKINSKKELIELVSKYPQLTNLIIDFDYNRVDLAPISRLKYLSSLTIYNCNFESLKAFEELEKLEIINLVDIDGLNSLQPISNLTHLKEFQCVGYTTIDDLIPLSNLSNLTVLELSGFQNVNNLEPLKNLNNLEVLILSDMPNIKSLVPLRNLKELRILSLEKFNNITGIDDLKNLNNINHFSLTYSKIDNIELLENFNLSFLDLEGDNLITDISVLYKLEDIDYVNLEECTGINKSDIKVLIELKPNTDFSY